MMLSSPSSTSNWIAIPCDKPYQHSSFICEYMHKHKGGLKEDALWKVHLLEDIVDCQKQWFYFNHKCIRLFVFSIIKSVNNLPPIVSVCPHSGGRTALLSKKDLLVVQNAAVADLKTLHERYVNLAEYLPITESWVHNIYGRQFVYLVDVMHWIDQNLKALVILEDKNTTELATINPQAYPLHIDDWMSSSTFM